MGGEGPFGESSGRPVPVAIESFQAIKARQEADSFAADGTVGMEP